MGGGVGTTRWKPSPPSPLSPAAPAPTLRALLRTRSWSLGTLIFEMLVGFAPFEGADQMATIRNILTGELQIPPVLAAADPDAADIIRQLLARNVVDRLGCRREGAGEIFRHKWFASIDFAALLRKELPAPWRPAPAADDDARYFETYEESDGEGEHEGPCLRPPPAPAAGGGSVVATDDDEDDDDDGDDGGDAFAHNDDLPARLLSPASNAAARQSPPQPGSEAGTPAPVAADWFDGF